MTGVLSNNHKMPLITMWKIIDYIITAFKTTKRFRTHCPFKRKPLVLGAKMPPGALGKINTLVLLGISKGPY